MFVKARKGVKVVGASLVATNVEELYEEHKELINAIQRMRLEKDVKKCPTCGTIV